jgi:hypothetical protein
MFLFEATRVRVAPSILKKWDAISPEKKRAFRHAAHDEMIKRLRTESEIQVERAFRQEHACLASLSNVDLLSPFGRLALEKDAKKLRDAATTLERAAKELRKRVGTIERPLSLSRGNDLTELRRVLVQHWVSPDGLCLCWMSYPALKKFLHLTCPQIPNQSAEALMKECQRLGLPKLDHPLVEERQIRPDGKGVSLARS